MTIRSDVAARPTLLRELRASIDNIDAALVHMLAERFRCTKAVGELKAEHNLPPADPAREEEQIARLRQLAEDAASRSRFRREVPELHHHGSHPPPRGRSPRTTATQPKCRPSSA